MKPRNLHKIYGQSKRLRARVVAHNTVAVTSNNNPVANQIVIVHFDADGAIHASCTCAWAINGGIACSHVLAALEALASKKGRRLSFWLTREEALRQKRRVFRIVDRDPKADDSIWVTSRAA
jgi:hypothetical protein